MKKILTIAASFCFLHYSNAQNPNANGNTQWKINGNNASTTDFMGTTNSQSLIFKTDNVARLQLDVQGKLILNSGKEMIINPDGLLRPEKTNPISAYMLKVGGSGHFDGELNTKQLFVQEYITYLKSLKGPSMNVDTIRMDSTRGIFGNTKIFGDVQIKQNLEVLGNAKFKGNLTAEAGFTFDGTKGLFYTPATATMGAIFQLGSKVAAPATNIMACLTPRSEPWSNFYFPGNFVSYIPAGAGVDPDINSAIRIGMASWNGNALIDVSGVGADGTGTPGLEINTFCKRNTDINMGWDLRPNSFVDGGIVSMGAEVSMMRSLRIGSNDLNTIDANTAIEINQNTDNGNGVKVQTWNNGIKAFSILKSDGVIPFVVYGDGSLNSGKITINGDATINSLAGATGAGLRGVMANAAGKLVLAPSAAIGSSWLLGGNAGGTNNKLGTNDNTDLQIITGTGTEKMRIDALGNVLINTATSTSSYYKKTLTVNGDVCFANYNEVNPADVHANDGFSGLEIVGNGKVPTRRGISVDADPNGDFNLYVNANQPGASFNFVNGHAGGLSNANPFLVRIASNGRTDINALVKTNPYLVVNDISDKEKSRPAFVVFGNGRTEIHLKESGDANALEVYDDNANIKVNFRVKQNGYVYAREINVMPNNITFPDYVFAKNYKLMPLNEVETYVNTNKHLPNIPTAKEVETNGINLAEMQVKQMEKIEELYLHLIELKKENESLKTRILILEKK